jgi:Cu(I)/Ag(I) efflux system membrane fusion protein
VFIQGKGDLIVPYEVKLGARSSDGYYEVVSGLRRGDKVVTSANFLVDSESSLKAAFKEATETK